MMTQSEIFQGRLEAHQTRISAIEARVSQLEAYNSFRDRPKPEGIREDLAAICKGQNISPESVLSKSNEGFREKRKGVIIQLVKRGWSQAAVAALFDRDTRTIRRLTQKGTWNETKRN